MNVTDRATRIIVMPLVQAYVEMLVSLRAGTSTSSSRVGKLFLGLKVALSGCQFLLEALVLSIANTPGRSSLASRQLSLVDISVAV